MLTYSRIEVLERYNSIGGSRGNSQRLASFVCRLVMKYSLQFVYKAEQLLFVCRFDEMFSGYSNILLMRPLISRETRSFHISVPGVATMRLVQVAWEE